MALSTPTHELRLPSGRLNGSTRAAAATNPQAELDDHYLVALAKEGRTDAYDTIVRRYRGFVRLKASSYFLLGGESDDLIQEGLLGLYKAIRDYRSDRESSFRSFAELCITRQIITAVKTATRNKHTPLNQYVSFSQTPAAAGDSDTTLDEILPGPSVSDPVNQLCAEEEWGAVSDCLARLSYLERVSIEGIAGNQSYKDLAERYGVFEKAINNAAQRARRKVTAALEMYKAAA